MSKLISLPIFFILFCFSVQNCLSQNIDPKTNLVTYKGSVNYTDKTISEAKNEVVSYLKGIEEIDSLIFTETEDGVIIDFLGKIHVSYSPKALADKMESGIGYALAKNSKPYGYFNYVGSVYIKENNLLYRFNEFDHYYPKKPKNSLGPIEQELGHKTNPLFWESYKKQVDATTKGMIAGFDASLNEADW